MFIVHHNIKQLYAHAITLNEQNYDKSATNL